MRSIEIESHDGIDRCVLDDADALIRHKELRKTLFFARREPTEVGLIVRERAAHQLDVGTVFIRELAIPCPAEVAAAPSPLLLAGRNVMTGHVQQSGSPAMIVRTDKVVI